MSIKEQIILLMKMYSNGEYDTSTFCNLFCGLYFYENNGRCYFEVEERKILDDFSKILERYSNDEDDLSRFPDTYYNNEEVLEAFNQVKLAFKI